MDAINTKINTDDQAQIQSLTTENKDLKKQLADTTKEL